MRVLAACALAMLSLATVSSADPIDFDSDTTGNKTEPFTSVDSPIVHFWDTVGNGLEVVNFAPPAGNHALKVKSDIDGSALFMEFDHNIASLSFDFGNDVSGLLEPGDLAILYTFKDGVFVGLSLVVPNEDGLINQTITSSGATFNEAYFFYGQFVGPFPIAFTGDFPRIGLAEVIDNVNYRVPEPSLLALSGLGALVVAWRRRRKAA